MFALKFHHSRQNSFSDFYLVWVCLIIAICYSIVTLMLMNQDFRGGVTTLIPTKTVVKTFMFSLEGFDPALIKGWNK